MTEKNKKRISLISVISKVKLIAEKDYNGNVYEHILSIFNKLTTTEKRILLRGLINICFIVEDKVLINSTDLDVIRTAVEDTNGINDGNNEVGVSVEDVKMELIKMRRYFLKLILISLLVIISIIVITVTTFDSNIYDSITKMLIKTFKYIILI